ncbi:hypothetical protein TrLO_g3484 [Triparma laevis f. longispina]|uniref:Uncharacterized protein n=1 Tax=Triparma laevis f. longispina TaxID=1714387 RepID=A0A9W7KRX4_9STRA|nr:hypothetical protein TrLO_g3484 [Triparma laevis f. longispina]
MSSSPPQSTLLTRLSLLESSLLLPSNPLTFSEHLTLLESKLSSLNSSSSSDPSLSDQIDQVHRILTNPQHVPEYAKELILTHENDYISYCNNLEKIKTKYEEEIIASKKLNVSSKQERLQLVESKTFDIISRSTKLQHRVDTLIDTYCDIVDKSNLINRIVEERLRWGERKVRDLEGKVGRIKK